MRSTSYVYPGTDITDAQARAFQAAGFEIALHLSTDCADFTPASLEDDWETQLPEFGDDFPSLAAPRTSRTHCIAWSDWASEPKVELGHGVRFDANYYYWPGAWVQDRPGMFTGSGFPMRFADADGSLIDVYQAATQLTDESDIDIDRHIQMLLDGALGSDGYYGVFTANMHTDDDDNPGADAIVAEAQARGVPVVSAVQMLDWLDGRNDSSFGDLSYDGTQLRFSVAPGAGARGLRGDDPRDRRDRRPVLADAQRHARAGDPAQTVKGVDYRMFDAAAGSYVATYGPGDDTPPDTTVGTASVSGDSATVSFSSNESGAQFECRLDGGPYAACDSPAHLNGLPDGSHTLTVRAIDLAGNVDATPASTSFVTAGAPAQDTTPPDTTIAGAIVSGSHARLTFSSNDAGAHFQCQLDGGAFAACTSPVDYNGLPDGAHSFRARAIDAAGNVDPTPATRTFTTLAGGSTPGTASPGAGTATPGGEGSSLGPNATRDRTAPRVTLAKRTLRASAKGVVALRVSCPRTEVTCRIAVRLGRAGHLLARRTVTVAGGKSANVSLQMSRNGRVSLARHRALMTEVTIDRPRRGRQPGNDQDPDPSPGAPTALGQLHQDDAGPRRTTCDTDVSSRRPWWRPLPWPSARPGLRRPRRPSRTTCRATSRQPVLDRYMGGRARPGPPQAGHGGRELRHSPPERLGSHARGSPGRPGPTSAANAAVTGGQLIVDGARVSDANATPTFSAPQTLEFRAAFGADEFQNIGFGDTFETGRGPCSAPARTTRTLRHLLRADQHRSAERHPDGHGDRSRADLRPDGHEPLPHRVDGGRRQVLRQRSARRHAPGRHRRPDARGRQRLQPPR